MNKPSSIQRGIRSRQQGRAAGDAPDIGRVARMPGAGMPKGERRRKRRDESRSAARRVKWKRQVMFLWSMLVVVCAISALGIVIFFWGKNKLEDRQRAATYNNWVADVSLMPDVELSELSEKEALRITRAALRAREVEDVERLFRVADGRERDVLGFLEKLEELDGTVSGLEWLRNMDANGMQIEGVLVNFRSDRPRNRLAMLTPCANGLWKVDFDAFARSSDPDWRTILSADNPQGEVRVYVAPDNYYNGPFAEESEWSCYGMASPDVEILLMAYCRKDSRQERAMRALLLNQDQKTIRATLRVRRVEGAESRQFEIQSVLADDWVMGDKPFDEKFR
jgi:hypothetical protein